MTATLTRTRSILTRDPSTREILFGSDSYRPYVKLTPEQWEDLGKPDEITIAIWPGDRQDIMEANDFPE